MECWSTPTVREEKSLPTLQGKGSLSENKIIKNRLTHLSHQLCAYTSILKHKLISEGELAFCGRNHILQLWIQLKVREEVVVFMTAITNTVEGMKQEVSD